jgi:hypothetical protein
MRDSIIALHNSNSIEQIPSWEANSGSDSQEITHLLWNAKLRYFSRKVLPLDSSEPHESNPYPHTQCL